ncbi:type II secretion system protein GspM [Deefgea rivuli]|uniref:type II secretion system protein GspM n=1 Tax=Deefgea rivuli TaxID=400948 RepID=UPI00055FE7EB|nr:type II secretion system protein GspM [Deefgea rivuli]
MNVKMQAWIQQGREYWQQRNPRERKMLSIWLLAVLCAILYFGIYAPLTTQIARLSVNVPRLEGHLLAMRGSKPEVLSVRGKDVDLRSAVFAALSIKKISADVRSISPTQLELRSTHASVGEALQLASALRGEVAAKVTSIQIKQDSAAVALLLVLERP